MERLVLAASIALLPLVVTTPARAMHCQGRIVSVGDAPHRVRSLCGEPTELVARVEQRTQLVQRRLPGRAIVTEAITYSLYVERWLYDFGPERFMRSLTFEDGALRTIETLGYGTVNGRARSKGAASLPPRRRDRLRA